ncbi:MAG: hypothetical protein ABJK59_13755 [Erythrobacter sp.]|uniref:hypothetical protein n=1 Tax=Erythrobacter sp. TaxID=1042 RepID=UPI003299E85B
MSQELLLPNPRSSDHYADALQWLAKVLTSFAQAEQAIGQLTLAMNLPIRNGSLSSIGEVLSRLESSGERRCQNLTKRIARWRSLRPLRHLLAHATIRIVYDDAGEPLIVTRHLPLDESDVTPDRVWTAPERDELLRIVTNDGRSIVDQVANLIQNKPEIGRLRKV